MAYLLFSPATYAATQHQAGSIPAHPTGALGDAGSQGGNAGHRMLAQAAPHIRTGDTSLSAAQVMLLSVTQGLAIAGQCTLVYA